jgi:hypothetical protein
MDFVDAYKKMLEIKKIRKEFDSGDYKGIEKVKDLVGELKDFCSTDLFDELRGEWSFRERSRLEGWDLRRNLPPICDQIICYIEEYNQLKNDPYNIEETVKKSKDLKGSIDLLLSETNSVSRLAKEIIRADHSESMKDIVMDGIKKFKNQYSKDEMKKAGISKEIIEQSDDIITSNYERTELINTIRTAYRYVKSGKPGNFENFIENKSKLEEALSNNDLNGVDKILEEDGIKGKRGYKYKHIIGLLNNVKNSYNPDPKEISTGEFVLAMVGPIVDHAIFSVGLTALGVPDAWLISLPIFNARNALRIFRVRHDSQKGKAFYATIPVFALPYYGFKKLNGRISNPFDREMKEVYKKIDTTLSSIDKSQLSIKEEPFSKIEEKCKLMFNTRDTNLPSFMEEVRKRRGDKDFMKLKNLLEGEINRNLESGQKVVNIENSNVDMVKFAEICGLDVSRIKKNIKKNIQEGTKKLIELDENLGG